MAGDGSGQVIDPELAFVHPLLHQALDYYRSKARDGVVCRADLDPADMRPYLPNVALFDVDAADNGRARYVYRLIGTDVAAHTGEHTGRNIDDVLSPDVLSRTRRALDTALARGAPIRTAARVADPRNAWLLGEGLVAPLSRDGAAADMVFAVHFFWPEDEQPGVVPLRRRRP